MDKHRQAQCVKLRKKGLPFTEIARRVGTSQFTARRDVMAAGMPTGRLPKNWDGSVGGRVKVPGVMLTLTTARERGIPLRRLRRNSKLGPWGNGFDNGWKDAQRGVLIPSPAHKWGYSLEQVEVYNEAYLEAHGLIYTGGVPELSATG